MKNKLGFVINLIGFTVVILLITGCAGTIPKPVFTKQMAPESQIAAKDEAKVQVEAGQSFMICLVRHELSGGDGAFEKPVFAVPVEPGDTRGMRSPAFTDNEQPGEKPCRVLAFFSSPSFLSEDDAGKTEHQDFSPSGSTTKP